MTSGKAERMMTCSRPAPWRGALRSMGVVNSMMLAAASGVRPLACSACERWMRVISLRTLSTSDALGAPFVHMRTGVAALGEAGM